MISYEEAAELVLDFTLNLGKKDLELPKARGYVLAENIVSNINVGPFRNSSKDGFAISSERLKNCSPDNILSLPITAAIFAGEICSENQPKGGAVKVMTGAPVPSVYDSVVMLEDTSYSTQQVTFSKPVAPGTNIRPAGEDIVRGQTIYFKGHCIEPWDIGILASIGLKVVPVFEKPSALIVCTGNELVEPGVPLKPGQIYNSNKFTIASMIGGFCEHIDTPATVHDTVEGLTAALNSNHQVIVTTGGVSVGEKDLVVKAAEAGGWETVFHKVAIKPGKPVYFARRKNQLLFGLPGNPLSAAITCAVFVVPALKKMAGYREFRLELLPAVLSNSPRREFDGTLIWPGKIWYQEEGIAATFSPKESSAALSALLGSDGLIFQKNKKSGGKNSPDVEIVTWQQVFNQ